MDIFASIFTVVQIAKVISNYLCDNIEEKESQKRQQILDLSNQIISETEYERRGVMISMLTKSIRECWEHVEILKNNKFKLTEQVNFAKKCKKLNDDFKSKYNKDFVQSLYDSITLNNVRTYYWQRTIQRLSTKKYELVSEPIKTKKILRKSFFKMIEFDEFLSNIPVKGKMVKAKSVKRNKSYTRIEFYDGFKVNVKNSMTDLFKGWEFSLCENIYVKDVDYFSKVVEVDPVITYIFYQIQEFGYENFKFKANLLESVIKNDKNIGYLIDFNGVNLFLPRSLIKNENEIVSDTAFYSFPNETLNTNKLVVKQI